MQYFRVSEVVCLCPLHFVHAHAPKHYPESSTLCTHTHRQISPKVPRFQHRYSLRRGPLRAEKFQSEEGIRRSKRQQDQSKQDTTQQDQIRRYKTKRHKKRKDKKSKEKTRQEKTPQDKAKQEKRREEKRRENKSK
jgi:hypothetical protein